MPFLSKVTAFLWIAQFGRLLCLAHGTSSSPGRPGHGLIGYGIPMWEPPCAYACQRVVSTARLECSTPQHVKRHGHEEADFTTSPDCFAHDQAFLLSLAWCLHEQCSEGHRIELWRLEKFWATDAVPDSYVPPKYSYTQALELCGVGLEPLLVQGQPLEKPSAVRPEDRAAFLTYLQDFSRVERQHSLHGIVLVAVMVLLPLVLSCLQYLTAATWSTAERKLLAHVVEPALLGRRHLVSLPYNIGIAPLRGQALLIAFVMLLNMGMSEVQYNGALPNAHYESKAIARWTYAGNRLGALSFANLVIVFLYSGRNNPLIILSGWSYGTFLLLHRWVAYICVIQAVLHSVIHLLRHIHVLSRVFSEAYWNVGAAGTITFVLIFATSILPIRRRWYQLFADLHNVLAVIALLLCYYHVFLEFGHKWGYENWIILAALLWLAERLVRAIKIATHGVHEASVTRLDDEYFEIHIEGVAETGYVYLYFPQNWWRIWENHPFSVASSVKPLSVRRHLYATAPDISSSMFDIGSDADSECSHNAHDLENVMDVEPYPALRPALDDIPMDAFAAESKRPESPDSMSATGGDEQLVRRASGQVEMEPGDGDALLLPKGYQCAPCLTMLVRRQQGLTNVIFNSPPGQKVLVEGPYSCLASLPTLSAAKAHVVCIAGGSGISAVLPLLRARASASVGRTVLYWSCRSEALAKASAVRDLGTAIETHVLVGERWDADQIVRREAEERHGDVAVVVCGPAAMADDVRYAVVHANRRTRTSGLISLYEECYSW